MHWVRPMRTGKCKELKGQKFDLSGTLAREYQEINFYTQISQPYEWGIIIPILDRIYTKYQVWKYYNANATHTEGIPVAIVLNLSLTYLIYFQLENKEGTSLVAQWLWIHLSVQETRLRALVWEDPTGCRATKPVSHNCWAPVPQLLKPAHLEPVLCNKDKPLQWEACALQQRPNSAINK